VRTRRLIVAALVCALAILVAGVVQLLRISGADEPDVELLAEGQPATVGGVTVSVTGSVLTIDALSIVARFAPASGVVVPVSSFTLLAGGKLEAPTNTDATGTPLCPPTIEVGTGGLTCSVSFPRREGSATVAFSRGGEQQVWRLQPTTASSG
jgi:hypothetical protein